MSLDASALKHFCLWCEFQTRLLFIISLLLKKLFDSLLLGSSLHLWGGFGNLLGSRNFTVFLLMMPLHAVASAVFAASPPFLLDVLCKVSSHFSTEVLSVKVPGAYLPCGCHGYLPGSLAAPLV